MPTDKNLNLTDQEIAQAFSDPAIAAKFPPILDINLAAELLRVPVGTLRDWRSRGLLCNCSRRVGREIRFFRDRLVKQFFNHGFSE